MLQCKRVAPKSVLVHKPHCFILLVYNSSSNGFALVVDSLLRGGGLIRKFYFLNFILCPQSFNGLFGAQRYYVFLKRETKVTGFCEKVGKNVGGETGKRRRARLWVGQAGGRGVMVFG